MAFKISLDKRALNDIIEASDYYEEQAPDLGTIFKLSVQREIDAIALNPYARVRYKNIRCAPLKKFPHMIHFTLNEESSEIIIHSIFNTYKDNARWPKKDDF